MNDFMRGITYSYNRNIGWQDRAIRTVVGLGAAAGAIYFLKTNITYSILLGILAIAQFGTIFSARCIICYFAGKCTIDRQERRSLEAIGNFINQWLDTLKAKTQDEIIDYAYFSEGEDRTGQMKLSYRTASKRYEGDWKTTADNGNVYQGSIYLVFSKGGPANGKYRFMNSDYKITIFSAL